MANINEIKEAINVAKNNNCTDLSLLHCVSGYPTPLEQCNLKAISTLKSLGKDIKIGWSDHSKNPDVLLPSSYTADAYLFLNTAKELDYNPKLLVAQNAGYTDPKFIATMGSKSEGVITR